MFMPIEALKHVRPGFVPPTPSGNGTLVGRLRGCRPSRALSGYVAQFSSHPVSITECNWPRFSVATSTPSASTGCGAAVSSVRALFDDRLGPAVSETAIVFTPDAVRLHDHPALAAAASAGHRFVVPVLVAHQGAYDLHGGHCAWVAAVTDLRRSLRARGSDVVVVNGSHLSVSDDARESAVARVVIDVCDTLRAGTVYTHTCSAGNPSPLYMLCDDAGVDCIVHWNGTVLHPKDLPFDLCDLPNDCDAFACATEFIKGNEPSNLPTALPPLSPDALRMVTGLPPCPSSSSAFGDEIVQPLSRLPFSESEALRTATSFFSSRVGVASALPALRSNAGNVSESSCACLRKSSHRRSIDTTLGRLGEALASGTLSSRQLNYIMAKCELSSTSPRCFCAKLEIMQHDFAMFWAFRRALASTAPVEHPSKSLSY